MQFIAIALMGFFAFSGSVAAPVEAQTLETEAQVVATSTAIALAEPEEIVRPTKDTSTFTVKLTSYNAVPEQTDANPHTTASGATSNSEVVAARSVDLAGDLPFGTVIAIEREAADTNNCRFAAVEHLIGYRVVADSMHSRKRNQIDVMLDPTDTVLVHGEATNPSMALGVCGGVTIRVIGKINIKNMPASQEELAKIVAGNSFAAR